jgi:hypothetical protein
MAIPEQAPPPLKILVLELPIVDNPDEECFNGKISRDRIWGGIQFSLKGIPVMIIEMRIFSDYI